MGALKRLSASLEAQYAGLFLRLGYVERVGSGIARIRAALAEAGLPAPEFESGSFFTVRFPFSAPTTDTNGRRHGAANGAKSGTKSGAKSALSEEQAKVLEYCRTPRPLTQVLALLQRADRSKLRQRVLAPLLAAGWLARTAPDKPRSRFQQYVTTPAGKRRLALVSSFK